MNQVQFLLLVYSVFGEKLSFYQKAGVVTKESKLQLVLIQQKYNEEMTILVQTPNITKYHRLQGACKEVVTANATTRDKFNNMVQNMIIESFSSSFKIETGQRIKLEQEATTGASHLEQPEIQPVTTQAAITKTAEQTETTGQAPSKGTIDEELEKYIKKENNENISDWTLVSPTLSDIDIEPMTDGSYARGFQLAELCKTDDVEYTFEGEINVTPLVHVVFSKITLEDLPTSTKGMFSAYMKYSNSEKDTIREICPIINGESFQFTSPDGDTDDGAILSIRCPSQKDRPNRVGQVTFGIKIRLRSDSIFCKINLKEITTQSKSANWYGRNDLTMEAINTLLPGAIEDGAKSGRKRRQVMAITAATGLAAIGSTVYNFFNQKGLKEKVLQLENVVNHDNIRSEEGRKSIESSTDELAIELDSTDEAIRALQQQQCSLEHELQVINTWILAESVANTFVNRIMNTVTEVNNNSKGNLVQNTVSQLCMNINTDVKNNGHLCNAYYEEEEAIKILFIQVHRVGNQVKVAIRLKITKPRLHVTPATVFQTTTIPTPLGRLEENIYRYATLEHVPNMFVHLKDYNQTLSVDETCVETDEILFCGQTLLNSIYSLKASCIDAVRTHGETSACGMKVIHAVSDCIVDVQQSFVLMAISEVATFVPHKADQISIHHQQNNMQKFEQGVGLITARNITADGFVMCAMSKVFIKKNLLTTVDADVTVNMDGTYTMMEESSIWETLAKSINMTTAQLDHSITNMNVAENSRKMFLMAMKQKRTEEQQDQNVPYPMAWLQNNRKIIDGRVLPTATVINTALIAVSGALVAILLLKRWLSDCAGCIGRSRTTDRPTRSIYRQGTSI